MTAHRSVLVTALAVTLGACAAAPAGVPEHARRPLAQGFFSSEPPPGEVGPSNSQGRAATPKVVSGFQQPPQTNDWWSSLIWGFRAGRPESRFSEPMFPHPLSLQAEAGGLQLGYTTEPRVDREGYYFPHHAELLVGVEGLSAPDARVARYGDWTVTARWQDGSHSLDLTAGHGLPFVYATGVRGKARVAAVGEPLEVWKNEGAVAAIKRGGHAYALFGPPRTTWKLEADALVADLEGNDYFSVAVLPDANESTLALFKAHAYAFVTDSKVSYVYDQARARVTTRFELVTESKTSDPATPLTALYRHQWLNSSAATSPLSYVSPRGEMKLLAAASFETSLPISGILPALPSVRGYDRSQLSQLLKLTANDTLFKPGLEGTRDSYWEGKSFGKVAGLVRIADQLGEPGMRDDLLAGLKEELEDWFDGRAPRYYYRNETWRTLIGIPTMYGSGAQLNDHHFHYGYYVLAAATIAQYDRAWAERWAPFVEALIKDAANWQRSDQTFPFLRYFDPYAGHSWATGTTFFETGNNQESSSEDMNFAAAVALWGSVMDRPALRDLGLFLYGNVTEAIAQYWFDVDGAAYPKSFSHPAIGIAWGSGAAYGTWFSPLVESIHGIQLTPMLPGSLWMGRYPDRIDRVFEHVLEARDGRSPVIWRDMFWMMLALSHPEQSAKWLSDEHHFETDSGNSLAYTYHFINTLKQLGRVAPDITADTPLHAAFRNGKLVTRVAFNPSDRPLVVSFSDGTKLQLAPRALGTKATR